MVVWLFLSWNSDVPYNPIIPEFNYIETWSVPKVLHMEFISLLIWFSLVFIKLVLTAYPGVRISHLRPLGTFGSVCFCRAELRSHENSGHQWYLFSGYLWEYADLKSKTMCNPLLLCFWILFACKYILSDYKTCQKNQNALSSSSSMISLVDESFHFQYLFF